MEKTNGNSNKWIFGLILTIAIHTAGIAFAAGTLWAKVDQLERALQEARVALMEHTKSPQYTRQESDERLALRDLRITNVENRITAVENRTPK